MVSDNSEKKSQEDKFKEAAKEYDELSEEEFLKEIKELAESPLKKKKTNRYLVAGFGRYINPKILVCRSPN